MVIEVVLQLAVVEPRPVLGLDPDNDIVGVRCGLLAEAQLKVDEPPAGSEALRAHPAQDHVRLVQGDASRAVALRAHRP